jgi:sialic acid synthase SpsE
MKNVKIGGIPVAEEHSGLIIGKTGIKHNADVRMAKRLIEIAETAGYNTVTSQKRT